MKNSFDIQDFEQLRAIADPLRRKILETFCQPLTTKQVAIMLDEKPTKLYHHVDALEKAGLITLVKTQQNRGTVEKYYQAVAKTFSVDRNLLKNSSAETKNKAANLIIYGLEETLKNISESVENGLLDKSDEKKVASMMSGKFYLNKSKALKLNELLQNWLQENAVKNESDTSVHQLTMVVFPLEKKKRKS